MKSFRVSVAATMLAFASPAAIAQDAAMSAQGYVAMAASSDMFEIQSSQLALEKGQSEAVKEFAQQMVTDHTQTSEQLAAAARQAQIEVPDSMVEKHASMLEQLNNASGAEFDAAYMEAQATAHQEAVKLHSSYAENGESEPLKSVAERAVPIVTEHLEHARNMGNM